MPALLAALMLTALAPDPAAAGTVRATLMPAALSPLTLKGSGFARRERVRVTVTPTGGRPVSKRLGASRSGSFLVRFPGVATCNGLEGVAVGRRGSRASFQFAAVSCRE